MRVPSDGAHIVVQSRDLALLRGLFDCRTMTLKHAAELYFDGHTEMAKKRVQKLKAARLVHARGRSRFEPSTLFLTAKGVRIAIAGERGSPPHQAGLRAVPSRTSVSEQTMRHELAVIDIRAALHRAAPRHGLTVAEFIAWPALTQFRTDKGTVKPDAFALIQPAGAATPARPYYLELDRSTEALGVLCAQARKYRACRKARSCVAKRTWDATNCEHRFTVLYVLRSEARLCNFARRLLRETPPIRTLVWLTTEAAMKADPFGPIWLLPRDVDAASSARLSIAADATGASGGIHRKRLSE